MFLKGLLHFGFSAAVLPIKKEGASSPPGHCRSALVQGTRPLSVRVYMAAPPLHMKPLHCVCVFRACAYVGGKVTTE